jgi:hypothetical protein
MPRLTDPLILGRFQTVLADWKYRGFVTAKDTVLEWLATNLPNQEITDIAKLMYEHLCANREIDQVRERRPDYTIREYHYDFRLDVEDRHVYIETVLVDDDPNDLSIQIVSMHDV